jgi:6-phosphofructokinase
MSKIQLSGFAQRKPGSVGVLNVIADVSCAALSIGAASALRHVQERLLLLVKTAQQRVTCFLLEMSKRLTATDALPIARQGIADYLVLTIETVSRTMSQLLSMSRQRISTVAAVAALAFTAVIATTIMWSAIATPAGPVVMTKAGFDRSFADAAAAARPARVMTKADFDRIFADATAAAGPAYATGVQREELIQLLRPEIPLLSRTPPATSARPASPAVSVPLW